MADTEQFNYREAIDHIQQTIIKLQPPKSLLFVDDDERDTDLSLRVLKHFHVTVTVAKSGHDAREMLRNNKYDLVLFDLVMPGLDGLEFALGAAGLQPGARFILVTGYPMSPKVEAVLRLGAVMLAKPLTVESLQIILPLKISE